MKDNEKNYKDIFKSLRWSIEIQRLSDEYA